MDIQTNTIGILIIFISWVVMVCKNMLSIKL